MDAHCWVILFFATALQQVGVLHEGRKCRVPDQPVSGSHSIIIMARISRTSALDGPDCSRCRNRRRVLSIYRGKWIPISKGKILEVIGAFFWGLHFVVLGKFASRFEPISFASGQFFIAGAFNLLLGAIFEKFSFLTPLPLIGAILYRACLSMGIGYTLQVWAQKHTPPLTQL